MICNASHGASDSDSESPSGPIMISDPMITGTRIIIGVTIT